MKGCSLHWARQLGASGGGGGDGGGDGGGGEALFLTWDPRCLPQDDMIVGFKIKKNCQKNLPQAKLRVKASIMYGQNLGKI